MCEGNLHNDIAALSRAEKKMMFLSLEGSHPIGGTVILRLERISFALEDIGSVILMHLI